MARCVLIHSDGSVGAACCFQYLGSRVQGGGSIPGLLVLKMETVDPSERSVTIYTSQLHEARF